MLLLCMLLSACNYKHFIIKAQVKLRFTSAFNRLKFLSIFLSFYLSLSDAPNLDLNNPTNPLLKRTLIQLVYSSKVNTANIKE